MPAFDPASIDGKGSGIWRYAAMLPVVAEGMARVTLGEGWTPLIPDTWAGYSLYWKLDALMPTGSYKDRGVSVMVNWLKGLGFDTLADDSSGNAGASLACYAGRAGLRSCIFVPASAPEPKKAQIAIYGGELVEVPGPRSEATKAAEAVTCSSRDMAYASHAWHPAFLLGQMTVAWEIWEQLGGNVPDWLIVPTGHGGTLLGAWRGFQHLRVSGITNKLPRLIAVQAVPYTPVYDAFVAGADFVQPTPHMERISADGIAISYPVRWHALLEAIRYSRGIAVAVEEEDVVAAHTDLAARGLFVEPTSATIAAALSQLPSGLIKPRDTLVAILTGHGLKNPPRVSAM
ncbi:MAG: threonine synthase [Caldilineaceae bacterium]|nr:threonine synthase [Caldilineaceae bacterium]